MITFLERLRKKSGMSQEYLAKKLNMSRPTVGKIFSGERELTVPEARSLAQIFDISLLELLNENVNEQNVHVKIESKKELPKKQVPEIRISVPQEKLDKFKQALLFITKEVGALPNVGQTVLYKLLYFCDFDYYEKFEEQLIGARYIKNHYGPTPVAFKKIVDDMVKNGEIEIVKTKYFQHEQTKYLPIKQPQLNVFSGRELQHIREVLNRLAHKSAGELSDLSHEDVPWITTEEGQVIDYEAVFYRTSETSVRQYPHD